MPIYRIGFYTQATTWIDVEANSKDEALDLAYERTPGFPYLRDISFDGDWEAFDEVTADGEDCLE